MIIGIILITLICCSGADHAEISFEKVTRQDFHLRRKVKVKQN